MRRRLDDAARLTQFGVNLQRLPSGQWSSQRRWRSHEDEFVWVVEGEVVLVTEAGEVVLRAGDCAGFKAGDPDGHHLQNRSDKEAVLLEVGGRSPGEDGATIPVSTCSWRPPPVSSPTWTARPIHPASERPSRPPAAATRARSHPLQSGRYPPLG